MARKAAKKIVKKAAPKPVANESNQAALHRAKDWPDFVREKHTQRREDHAQHVHLQREAKKQRMIDNGVPAEKRAI